MTYKPESRIRTIRQAPLLIHPIRWIRTEEGSTGDVGNCQVCNEDVAPDEDLGDNTLAQFLHPQGEGTIVAHGGCGNAYNLTLA